MTASQLAILAAREHRCHAVSANDYSMPNLFELISNSILSACVIRNPMSSRASSARFFADDERTSYPSTKVQQLAMAIHEENEVKRAVKV